MNSDLLPALAAVSWAKSKLPSFQERIDAWFDANYTVTIRETPTDRAYDLVIITSPEFPITFSIEAGSYINTIRCSLDILACTLAEREPKPFLYPDKIYFPVAESALEFSRGGYKGSEFVAQLSGTARRILEEAKPYKGGNIALWNMHRLDIIRKHKRLLIAGPLGSRLHIDGWDRMIRIPDSEIGDFQLGKQETLLGGWAKGSPNPKVEFTGQVVVSEVGIIPGNKRIISLLEGFANCATTIIESFNY